ncbi:hypothetical protein BU14_0200s0045 [Porphyra umbilicalis]|uniref:Uncharacterized protein n=1 Tax=Porphyra umbilicalis TaxID=2786 RepID=A0A1X6P6C9_PORUM|nr:hypothetical protein BU14_0200s0045 [Porphyra umbilicalis]|eukprot:OSX76290.1 hypothetical protein BU14_0200s0045 [Porphyra umbilicalis]
MVGSRRRRRCRRGRGGAAANPAAGLVGGRSVGHSRRCRPRSRRAGGCRGTPPSVDRPPPHAEAVARWAAGPPPHGPSGGPASDMLPRFPWAVDTGAAAGAAGAAALCGAYPPPHFISAIGGGGGDGGGPGGGGDGGGCPRLRLLRLVPVRPRRGGRRGGVAGGCVGGRAFVGSVDRVGGGRRWGGGGGGGTQTAPVGVAGGLAVGVRGGGVCGAYGHGGGAHAGGAHGGGGCGAGGGASAGAATPVSRQASAARSKASTSSVEARRKHSRGSTRSDTGSAKVGGGGDGGLAGMLGAFRKRPSHD